MMGDGTEEQNLDERGNSAGRIKKDEVEAAFGKHNPKNGLLQIEWVKRSGFSQVDSDSKGFLVNLPVTSWRHVCAHAKIDQDETPER
jgi:hypothetical protein